MRQITLALFSIVLLAISCRKNDGTQSGAGGVVTVPMNKIKHFLQDSLTGLPYSALDFSAAVYSTTNGGRTNMVRIPEKGFLPNNRFVLIRYDSSQSHFLGEIIQIAQDTSGGVAYTTFSFNGSIVSRYLSGQLKYESAISKGFILSFHKLAPNLEAADEDEVELPEIIIYAPDEEYYADYDLIFDGGGGGASSDGSGYGYSSSGGGSGASGSSVSVASSFNPANEIQAAAPAIQLQQFVKCFSLVADAGATYSASLLVSIPNASNPSQMWNPLTGRVGHTFIQLTKTNGGTSVTQYIGFYAGCGFCAIGGDPVSSKLVDNSSHPYNASLTLNVSADDFQDLISAMGQYANNDYSLCNYNCTAYALDVFNSVLNDPLSPPLMTIPGGTAGEFPNGLYILLEQMPKSGDDGVVTLYPAVQTASEGHGACN